MAQATTATYDHPLPDRYGKALAVAEETRDLPEPRVSRDGTGPRRSVRYGLDRERPDRRVGAAIGREPRPIQAAQNFRFCNARCTFRVLEQRAFWADGRADPAALGRSDADATYPSWPSPAPSAFTAGAWFALRAR